MAANPPPPFEVWAVNWEAFGLFRYMGTQWHRDAGGGLSGLIYSEAYKRMDEIGIDQKPRRLFLMSALRSMEAAVIEEMAKRNRRV